MMSFAKPLSALVLVATLAACADAATTPRFGNQPPAEMGRLAYERVNRVDYYEWMGRRYTDEAALIADLDARMAEQIETITPQAEPSGKTLRVLLPPPAPVERGVGRFYHRLDELRLDGLRKSAMFSDFEVETLSMRDPGTDGRDFVLYRSSAGVWRLKDTQGRGTRLLSASSAQGFVNLVSRAVDDLSGDMEHLTAIPLEGGVSYNFRGKEYSGLRGLRSAFDSELAEQEKRVVGVTPPLADSALVVLPRDTSLPPETEQGLEKFPILLEAVPGFEAFRRYQDRRSGQFIGASGLFKSVRVVTADGGEPEQGGYDWVFWRLPGQKEWMMRAKEGVAFSESMPISAESFAEELRAKLTQPR